MYEERRERERGKEGKREGERKKKIIQLYAQFRSLIPNLVRVGP